MINLMKIIIITNSILMLQKYYNSILGVITINKIMLNKRCSNCLNNMYGVKDGYLICLECGFIVSSRTFEDFTPIGFIEDKTNGIADYIKLLKKHNPDLTEEKLINRLNLFTDKTEKEILRAVRNDTRRRNHRRRKRR